MKMVFKLVSALIFSMGLVACSSGNCRSQDKITAKTLEKGSAGDTGMKAPQAERIKIYKFDGSLQCGQGKATPVAEMQKELGTIQVFSSQNKNDGMMRIQVCGAPTGNCNIYEIPHKDLEAAQKKGFKEWVMD